MKLTKKHEQKWVFQNKTRNNLTKPQPPTRLSYNLCHYAMYQQAVIQRQCFETLPWATMPAADIWSDNMVVNNVSGYKDKKDLLEICKCPVPSPYLPYMEISALGWSRFISHTVVQPVQGWHSCGCFFSVCVYRLYHFALLDSVHFIFSTNTHRHLPPDVLDSVSAWLWQGKQCYRASCTTLSKHHNLTPSLFYFFCSIVLLTWCQVGNKQQIIRGSSRKINRLLGHVK